MASSNIKHTWTTSIKNDSGSAVTADPPLILTGDCEMNFSQVLNPADSSIEVDITITVSKIISGFVNQTTAGNLFTNSSTGSGGQTIALVANVSVAWNNTMITVNPFTPNITKFYANNPGGTIATVRGGFLCNTP